MLILQHKRERFHPFGTARIVARALGKAELRVGLDGGFAGGLGLKPGAGLLYPGPDAELLNALPPERRPRQLVVLDGTWHHAKTMFRDLPELQALPRYRLAPTEPSRYGFRREPHAQFISTVEATIGALRVLEPELAGLDQLMDAFLTMVNRQLGRSKANHGVRKRKRPRKTFQNVPVALVDNLENIVVAYGESAASVQGSQDQGAPRAARTPAHWVAERLGTGERFGVRISPPGPLDEMLLRHWELAREEFADALSPAEAGAAWRKFLRPTDVLTVYNQGVADLAKQLDVQPHGMSQRGVGSPSCLVLKSVDLRAQKRYATLDELIVAEEIAVGSPRHPGRAGKRLANLAAFVRHLHGPANESPGDTRLELN